MPLLLTVEKLSLPLRKSSSSDCSLTSMTESIESESREDTLDMSLPSRVSSLNALHRST